MRFKYAFGLVIVVVYLASKAIDRAGSSLEARLPPMNLVSPPPGLRAYNNPYVLPFKKAGLEVHANTMWRGGRDQRVPLIKAMFMERLIGAKVVVLPDGKSDHGAGTIRVQYDEVKSGNVMQPGCDLSGTDVGVIVQAFNGKHIVYQDSLDTNLQSYELKSGRDMSCDSIQAQIDEQARARFTHDFIAWHVFEHEGLPLATDGDARDRAHSESTDTEDYGRKP